MDIDPSTNDNKDKRRSRRKKNTNVACIHCSRCHLSCDSNRPCKRCVDKGISDTCIDAPRKRHKYLLGVPNDALPVTMQNDSSKSSPNDSPTRNSTSLQSKPSYQPTDMVTPTGSTFERQHFHKPQYIIHKSKFLSNAADVEYSMLSNMIQQDGLLNKIPVDNILYHDNDNNNNNSSSSNNNNININNNTSSSSSTTLTVLSQKPSGVALNTEYQQISADNNNNNNNINMNTPRTVSNENIIMKPCKNMEQNNDTTMNIIDVPTQQYPSIFQNVYSVLLGPHSDKILDSKVDLFTHHFPLIPIEPNPPGNNSLSFKRLIASDISYKYGHLQKNNKINQIYLNNETMTFPEVKTTYLNFRSNADKMNSRVSFALECSSPETTNIKSNSEWEHSLRYSTPMEIYTMINKPFSHTAGFHHLLMYLRSRFNKRDIIEICRSMAEFRPIFIACSMTLTEEDMIFMEQCYQRTLLEYAKFLEQVGTPTCIWRRNGQISYMNEEFEVLTGWKREELLNKMTFIVEILDDESVRDYFKTFSSVAYKDFRGSEYMKTCRILSPIKGNIINCRCMWTLKRDISGLPLMILGNFMPILEN